jgi:hypothetical protein
MPFSTAVIQRQAARAGCRAAPNVHGAARRRTGHTAAAWSLSMRTFRSASFPRVCSNRLCLSGVPTPAPSQIRPWKVPTKKWGVREFTTNVVKRTGKSATPGCQAIKLAVTNDDENVVSPLARTPTIAEVIQPSYMQAYATRYVATNNSSHLPIYTV